MDLSFFNNVEDERTTLTNMDITNIDTSNSSTTDDIRSEDDEENLQDNKKQEQTKNPMSNLPSSSYARKRRRPKEDTISVILAKRLKDTNDTLLSILKKQTKLLAKNMKTVWEEDDIDMFYKSIAMKVKKMSPQEINQAKLNTLTGVSAIGDQFSTLQTAQSLPNQQPSNYNNKYQWQLNSPANPYYNTSTSSRGFLPFRFNYDDTSNI
ncbi:hypothetical protein AGLY_001509 [Aphis glycines]|uniref:BESS domain-containing protein n=1 Tax=Aphis glycines TaxID=307491 RepID=A0A6G0U6C7_APHGL|nr:hypothetical protein AGLY_001509 [Aphis glycines]